MATHSVIPTDLVIIFHLLAYKRQDLGDDENSFFLKNDYTFFTESIRGRIPFAELY